MKPSDYRRAGYTRSIKQNNFYNGTLPLGFMNQLHPPTEVEIWQTQRTAIMTYSMSMRYQKMLRGLNQNIFQGAAQGFDPSVDAAVTNQLAQEITYLREQYYPTIKTLRNKKQLDENQIGAIKTQCSKLFIDYTRIIKMLTSSMLISSQELVGRLEILNSNIEHMSALISHYTGLPAQGGEIADYFYRINTLFSRTMGIVLENEALDTVSGWLPTNMEIKGIGALHVGPKSQMAGVDNIVFEKAIMDQIKITWEQSSTGGKTRKTKHQGTLAEFFSEMETKKQTSFYISESEYAHLCRIAIATLQAKAMGTTAKNMIVKRDVQLFEGAVYKMKNGLTLPSLKLNSKFSQYSTNYLNALTWMKRLYELSLVENPPKGNYIERHAHYQAFINYSLSKMIPFILDNNEYLLSNRYGVISFYDFFEKNHKNYFTWGINKTARLGEGGKNPLAKAKYDILLRT